MFLISSSKTLNPLILTPSDECSYRSGSRMECQRLADLESDISIVRRTSLDFPELPRSIPRWVWISLGVSVHSGQ